MYLKFNCLNFKRRFFDHLFCPPPSFLFWNVGLICGVKQRFKPQCKSSQTFKRPLKSDGRTLKINCSMTLENWALCPIGSNSTNSRQGVKSKKLDRFWLNSIKCFVVQNDLAFYSLPLAPSRWNWTFGPIPLMQFATVKKLDRFIRRDSLLN